MRGLLKLPLLVILVGFGAVAMLVPMAHAVRINDYQTARMFLQYGILILLITGMVAVATSNYPPPKTAHSQLLGLLAAFIFLPVVLALPFAALMPSSPFFDIYFEMLSALTTTGATVFDDPDRLSEPLHLWRALVAWLGGFLMWVSAIAIMAPLSLGGFEVLSAGNVAKFTGGVSVQMRVAGTSERLVRYSKQLAPIYLLITLFLVLGLFLSGERFFVAVIHAMSTISTSGISSIGGLETAGAGIGGEVLIFLFLIFAVTRLSISASSLKSMAQGIWSDHEFRLMMIVVTSVPILLFMRHWIGAFEVNDQENFFAGIRALWGGVFTVLSFMTTTGFVSQDWTSAQSWSGLQTPGLILIGLAVMGGGVATTAGGVKLLRVYALYKHSYREMQKLTYPTSVGGAGRDARHIRREGAYLAWIFFMLFTLSAALIMLALSLSGLDFDESLILSIAALSTTGPLASVAGETAISYGALGDWPKAILSVAMVLGRFETLAIIALLNPDFWRK